MYSRNLMTAAFVVVVATAGVASATDYPIAAANGNWTDVGRWDIGPPDTSTEYGLIRATVTVDSTISTGGFGVGHGPSSGSLIINYPAIITVLTGTNAGGPGTIDVGGTGLPLSTVTQNGGSLTVQDQQFGATFGNALTVGSFGPGSYALLGGSLTTELFNLQVGWFNTGTFNQSAGTSVSIGSTLTGASVADVVLGIEPAASGTYNMNGGTLSVFGTIRKGAGAAAFNFNNGLITLKGNQVGFDGLYSWFTPTAPGGTVYAESYSAGLDQTTLFFAPVPEPSSMVLIMAGAIGCAVLRRRAK